MCSGEYFDEETGLIYLRNRYYDASTGRFITEDPIRDGLNWYAYCGNNPVNCVDPWGLYEQGDEKLPVVEQAKINVLTTLFYQFNQENNIAARDAARKKAVEIRRQYWDYVDTYNYCTNYESVKMSMEVLSAGAAHMYGGDATNFTQEIIFPSVVEATTKIIKSPVIDKLTSLDTIIKVLDHEYYKAMSALREGDVRVVIKQDYTTYLNKNGKLNYGELAMKYTTSFYKAEGMYIASDVSEIRYRYTYHTPNNTYTNRFRYANSNLFN
ncbi:MAG: RHS repeat-associated core domain-containing protein [Clostridia bacterium]|nr:RHS repeat-associated core domain-containing protein [Clostridia bacterium]